MSRTIIISNRLPVTFKHEDDKLIATPSGGGLATGLSSFYKNEGNLWIGWPGIVKAHFRVQGRRAWADPTFFPGFDQGTE